MSTLTILASSNGAQPSPELVEDAAGDLFGTATAGGVAGEGTVFEIVKTADGYASTPVTLATFAGGDGAQPEQGLIADAAGDLFGVTLSGGANDGGTVFEIAKTADGYASTPVTLATFDVATGNSPETRLVMDANGDLFGTTSASGDIRYGPDGTVFEIAKTAGGYASTPRVLASFSIAALYYPASGAGLAIDSAGDLFGGTEISSNFNGTIFEIANAASSGASLSTISTSNYPAGFAPYSAVVLDAAGDLFGLTFDGVIYEVANTASGYASTPTLLVRLPGPIDNLPTTALSIDANGDLFGTYGEASGTGGTVFELAKTASGYASAVTPLGTFEDGTGPGLGLVTANGTLFGTTQAGGDGEGGTVFEIASGQDAPATLASFDDFTPIGAMVMDASGDLFGTTAQGGADDLGTVFEIAKTADGYAGPTTLASFGSAGSASPDAGLTADAAGDLFGITSSGGAYGDGMVFELARTASGYAGTPVTVASFTSAIEPSGTLAMDQAGDLFGTSAKAIFEIAKTPGGYGSTPITLAPFSTTAALPNAGLTVDANGDLFGTTEYGGNDNSGSVFELAKTATGYAASATTLASLGGNSGVAPVAALVMDAAGDLFGTASFGGYDDDGTVFEIAKTATGYATTLTLLASFSGPDGAQPDAPLLIGAGGRLFGTTSAGGAYGDGTVFEIATTAGVYTGTATTLYNFDGTDGGDPSAGLLGDASGDLFGASPGSVFELTGTDFSPACYCHGTRILTAHGEVAVEDLAIGDAVVTAAGSAKPVRWIGRRSYAGRFLAGQPNLLPILFRAGSLGGGLPRRDLRVSPNHAMFLDGALVPAACLVNGTSILREAAVTRVDYLHIELDRHDVILAEGAASETFLDDGSRFAFHNARDYAARYPDAPVPGGFCAPRVERGFALEAIRNRLALVSGQKAAA